MVQIKAETQINEKQYPLQYKWDVARRQNYNTYEEKINENLYQHQRIANTKLPYRIFYPHYYQHYFLDASIYKNLQALGKYFDEEVSEYRSINPRISSDLRHTFKSTFPTYGLAIGLALQYFPIKYKLSLANNVTLLLAPILVNWAYERNNVAHKHNANQFLDWTLQRRIAQAKLERSANEIDKEQIDLFKQNFPGKSPLDLFKEYSKL